MRGQTACAIAEDSAVGAARRLATQIATKAGLSETETGKLQIVVTELGRNVCRHAGHGTLFLQSVHDGGATGVEVLAVDGGPGMSSVEKALRDGYSTKQSAGAGLGAVQRLSTVFDIYSRPGMGTIVLSRILGAAGSSRGGSAVRPSTIITIGALVLGMIIVWGFLATVTHAQPQRRGGWAFFIYRAGYPASNRTQSTSHPNFCLV